MTKFDFSRSLTTNARSRSIQQLIQPTLHLRPLLRHDRKARRIASDEVSSHPMRPQNPFELSADAFDGRARTLVTRVGVEADAEHLPGFEGVRQQEQLALGVGRGPDCRSRQPGIADLAGVGIHAAVPRMALWPCPSFQIKEACRPYDCAAIHKHSCE